VEQVTQVTAVKMDTVISLVRLQSISGQTGKTFINKEDRERERIEEEIKSNTVQRFFTSRDTELKNRIDSVLWQLSM